MITYTDKVQLTPNANPDINQWRAVDANEVKTEVNANITATAAKVPTSRILTIDGVAYDLSADRSWVTSGGVDKFPNIYNVTSYSLVGDGTTDNTAALDALVILAPAGSWLYFPIGTYLFGSTVNINKTLHLIGDGRHSALTMAADSTLISYTAVTDYLQIRNLQIYNSKAGTPTSSSIGLKANIAHGWRVENFLIVGFYTNIHMTDVWNDSWIGLYCLGWVDTGMFRTNSGIYVDAGDAAIANSWFVPATYNSNYSILQFNGGGTKITNTKFNYDPAGFQAQYHYYFQGTGTTVDLMISNCSFENYGAAAIVVGVTGVGAFKEVCITGNDIGAAFGGDAEGIVITGVNVVTITGNTLAASGSGTKNAIVLNDCLNCTVYNVYADWTNNVVQTGTTTVTTPVLIDPAVSPVNDDFLQRKSGAWTSRTIAQVKTDLDLISQTVTNGVTTKAPSEDAVYDAIASAVSGAGYVTVTGTDTLDSGDYNKTILCSGTSSDYAIALPTAVGITGVWFDFVGVSGLTKIVTVNANGSETINGLTVDRPFTSRGGFRIISDGANWQVVSEKPSWIAYTPSATTGFSGTPSMDIRYSLIGKQMSINYTIGPSAGSGTTLSFALPTGYTSNSLSYQYTRTQSNGGASATGMSEVTVSATNINFYTTPGGAGYTGAGVRFAQGIAVFEIQ